MRAGKPCGNLPQGETGKTRDKVSARVGMSGRTYEKAKTVVQAAEREPDDRTGWTEWGGPLFGPLWAPIPPELARTRTKVPEALPKPG